jgi:hypothetical protein
MSNVSNVCACVVCSGAECRCGCQDASSRRSAACGCGNACGCGDNCRCGDACTCKAPERALAVTENR